MNKTLINLDKPSSSGNLEQQINPMEFADNIIKYMNLKKF